MSSTWEHLRLHCEEATRPDKKLDALILCAAIAPRGAFVEQSRINGAWCIYEKGNRLFEISGKNFRRVTASLGAIVWLIERTLPDWAWKVGTCSVSDDAWLVPDFNDPTHGARLLAQFGPIASRSIWDTGIDIDRRPPGNVALALCEAYCAARAEIEKAEGRP